MQTSGWPEPLYTPLLPQRCLEPDDDAPVRLTPRPVWHLRHREHVQTVTGFQGSHFPHVLLWFSHWFSGQGGWFLP